MSYTDEYIREAIKSCKIYSDYCKSNEKSRIITKVSKISRGDTPRTFLGEEAKGKEPTVTVDPRLLSLIDSMTEEELADLERYAEFILSRKKG